MSATVDEVSTLIPFQSHLPHGQNIVMQSHSTTFGSVCTLACACTYILINQEQRLDARSAPLKILLSLSLSLFRPITLFLILSLVLSVFSLLDLCLPAKPH